MISKCRSRATDGGCVLKMKLLRWPRARERGGDGEIVRGKEGRGGEGK